MSQPTTAPSATAMRRAAAWSSSAAIPSIVLAVLAAIILLYFGLVGLGQWQADEYGDFSQLAQQGWRAFWIRLHWSPRPFSEMIFYAYGWLANRLHRPMIGIFLALLWCGLLATAAFPLWRTRRVGAPYGALCLAITGAGVLAGVLTGGAIFEVFYWPAGAVAYLPTMAASLLLFVVIAGRGLSSSRDRTVATISLSIAALSSEIGAVFGLCCVLTLVATELAQRSRNSAAGGPRPYELGWLVLPLVLSLAILAIVRLNRYEAQEGSFAVMSPQLGHPLPSAAAAAQQLARELIGWTPHVHSWLGMVPQIVSHVLIAIGAALCILPVFKRSPESRMPLLALSISLLLACLVSLGVAYLHSGAAAGERHETVRRCWILLSLSGILALALNACSNSSPGRLTAQRNVGPILLLCGVVMVWHVRPLVREYSAYRRITAISRHNFRDGYNASSRQMLYVNPPHQGILTPATLPPGIYVRGREGIPDFPAYILSYFDKDTLVVSDASSSQP